MSEAQTRADELVYRKASIIMPPKNSSGPSTLNVEARSVGIILATETPVREWDWDYGYVPTVLLMSGAVLPADGQMPLLDNHNRSSACDQIGSVRDATTKGDEMPATAFFSKIDKANQIFTLVCEDHLRDVSVGRKDLECIFVPEKTTSTIEGKTYQGPIKVVTRWEVREGSFTPIGADENAKTRAASDGENREENPMSLKADDPKDQGRAATKGNAPAAPQSAAIPAPAAEQNRAAPPAAQPAPGQSAESIRAEVADILLLGRTHNCIELAEEAIRGGTGLDAFRAQVLGHIASHTERHAPGYQPHVETGQEDSVKFRSAATDALLQRAGGQYAPAKPAAGAEDLRGYTLREMARLFLRRAGQDEKGDMDMVGRAFTTSDFPDVLANVARQAVLVGAQEAGETFDIWTGDSTANDFRDHTGVALDAFSSLDLVPEGGEYKTGQTSDSGIVYSVATYGKLFPITRQAIINDNLNVFTAIPMGMGRAAIRTCGDAVYALLETNPQLRDGFALFSTQHKNLSATGSKITTDAYSEGVTAMGTHVGKQNESLNISPVFLLTPVVRKAEARVLLNSQFIGTQAAPNQLNPWQNDVTPVTEGRLDRMAGKPWFLAGPKGWAVNVAWLFGNKKPRVEQWQGTNIDAVVHKVSIDFGAYINDFRCLFKNKGQ